MTSKSLDKGMENLKLCEFIESDIKGERIKPVGVGVCANTREEWMTLIIASWHNEYKTVPIYSNLGGTKYEIYP